VTGTEKCDGAALNNKTCVTELGAGATGTLSCKADCSFDTTQCVAPPECGDGIINGTEQCDGAVLGGATCTSAVGKPATGTLGCTAQCAFDTSACEFCGDGKVTGTEKCDGAALNNKTCATEGFAAGTLSCKTDCTFDTTQCTP
jgi:hypothetical protein